MPKLAMELDHLKQADEHIALARTHIAEMSGRISARDHGAEPYASSESVDLLQTMKGTLAAFEAHRSLILRSIEDARREEAEG